MIHRTPDHALEYREYLRGMRPRAGSTGSTWLAVLGLIATGLGVLNDDPLGSPLAAKSR